MKKILVAPQQFKESLSGLDMANSIENGILKVWPNSKIKKIPVADGGDGTLETLVENLEEKLDQLFDTLILKK